MPFLDPSDAPAPSVESADDASFQTARPRGMLGWQVLAVLQFVAAGSLVFALASHVFFPYAFRYSVFRSAPERVFSDLHGTASVAYQLALTQRRVCKTRSRVALKAARLARRVRCDEGSPTFSLLTPARGPRAPPS
jgi:hypothetical protein